MTLPHKSLPDQEVRRNFDALSNDLTSRFPVSDDNLLSANNSVYRTLFGPVGAGHTNLGSITTAQIIYAFGNSFTAAGGGTNAPGLIYLDDADYTVASKTTRLRIIGTLLTNATDPAIDVTFNLLPITACAGGAGTMTYTFGAAVGSVTITNANLAASTRHEVDSGDFAFPADGWYGLGAIGSGTQAANSFITTSVILQMRHT